MSSFSQKVLLALVGATQALERAPLIPQDHSLHLRADYNGGWPLGLPGASCPADTPVACASSTTTVNPTCCPSGQTCFGLTSPHCCPTSKHFSLVVYIKNWSLIWGEIDADCANVVRNLPVCANSSWNMYQLDSRTYFCCKPGQYGVLPLGGYTGICQPNDQVVASSLIASAASQVGGAAVATGKIGRAHV